jgi:hypothetical protein
MDKESIATIRICFCSEVICSKFVQTLFNHLQQLGVPLQWLGYKYLYLTGLISRPF